MKESKYLLKEKADKSFEDINDPAYSQIFKEVLILKNDIIQVDAKSYFLLRIEIANIREINRSHKKMDEISLMHAVSHTLFKILTPVDIYYIDDENFLFLLNNTHKKKIISQLSSIKKVLSKLFKQPISVEWEILKAAPDADSLKPFLSGFKMDFFRVRQARDLCIKKNPRRLTFRSMFKNFAIAYLIFFNVFLVAGIFTYLAGRGLSFIPPDQMPGAMISEMNSGFLTTLNVSLAPFAFLVFIGMTFSVLFGFFGMLLGWIMNVERRVLEKSRIKMIPKKM